MDRVSDGTGLMITSYIESLEDAFGSTAQLVQSLENRRKSLSWSSRLFPNRKRKMQGDASLLHEFLKAAELQIHGAAEALRQRWRTTGEPPREESE